MRSIGAKAPWRLALPLAVFLAVSTCSQPQQHAWPAFSGEEAIGRPNVLIVLVDALRRDHLGVYGYPLPTSPNIDAFADESLRFSRAYSHSTWTKPSVATLFTSVYAEQHGLGRVGFEDQTGFQTDVLPKQLVTLAERFRRSGYATGGFSTNVHVQRKTGFAQGFDHFFWRRMVDAFELNGLIQEWLDHQTGDRPFFAYLHYMDVHWPYNRTLDDETDRFGNTTIVPPPPDRWTRVAEWAADHLDHESLAAIVAKYDQEIAFTDAAFGELVEWLRQRKLLDGTIVVFLSDHGEGFSEHDELQHGFAPYREVTAVPMMIRLPQLYGLEPREFDDVVGLVDVLPTVLDLVDIASPKRAEGRSLEPLLLGERLRERPVYIAGLGERGMRSAGHTVLISEEGARRCFDLARDPEELLPLSQPLPEACDRLSNAIEGLTARLEPIADTDGSNETVTLTEEEVDALRALGYLD